jgi:hypothetical protein
MTRFRDRTGMVAAVWILGAGGIAVMADVTSIGVAAVVIAFAVLPPVLLLLRPHTPAPAHVTL